MKKRKTQIKRYILGEGYLWFSGVAVGLTKVRNGLMVPLRHKDKLGNWDYGRLIFEKRKKK